MQNGFRSVPSFIFWMDLNFRYIICQPKVFVSEDIIFCVFSKFTFILFFLKILFKTLKKITFIISIFVFCQILKRFVFLMVSLP